MKQPSLNREMCRAFIEQQLFTPRNTSKTDTLPGAVGVELECFPYRLKPDEGSATQVPLLGGEDSLMNMLVNAAGQHSGTAKHWHPAAQNDGYLSQVESIEFPDGDRLLFEPGGQVEISTAPQSSITALEHQLSEKQAILNLLTRQSDIHFAQVGIIPWWNADEMSNQLQKPRYRALEDYLNRIGPYGKQMMLQTCSLHINFDLGTTSETRAKRIVAANLLVPFATALFAHSAISECRKNGHKSYRSYVWQHLDATRTGILALERLPDNFSQDVLIDLYLDLALQAPVIHISEFGEKLLPSALTFERWMQHSADGLQPGIPHLANHVTLLFPEVRLNGYIEIRSVDAPPRGWQLIPVLFYAGLLYSDAHLDKVLALLLPLKASMKALHAEATKGLESDEIFSMTKKLMRLALDGFSGLPETFKTEQHTQQLGSFFERFTGRRKTFADEQFETFKRDKPDN